MPPQTLSQRIQNRQGNKVIDPRDPDAQRRFEMQQRGGTYSDRIKIKPKFNAPPRTSPQESDYQLQQMYRSQMKGA